jgi:ankyrin repeat protein
LKIVELLVSKGADINAQDKNGWAPLHYATWSDAEIAQLLILKGADINIRSAMGESPLFEYVNMGDKAMAQFLIDQGADVNLKNKRGETPLHRAAGEGDRAMVHLLISRGGDVNAITRYHFTPLHFAVVFGHIGVAECLIERGADLNIQSNDGGTPLHFADAAGNQDISKLLKAKGAEVRKRHFFVLEGDYFGLKKPGRTPELFAPHILYNISIFVSPCFSPEESFLIFHSNRPGGYNGLNDLYVSFHKKNGAWSEPINLGKMINSYPSSSAKVSPDGKYLFFTSIRDGILGTFWVDAKIIAELKPAELK